MAVGPSATLLGLVLVLGACGVREPGESPAGARAAPLAAPEPAAAPGPAPPVERDWPAAELRPGGGPVAAELGRGEAHLHRIPLRGGDFLRLEVEQHDVDVELVLRDPASEELLSADRIIAARGPELVMAVAEQSGTYTLEVRAFPRSGPGRYEARIEALRPASDDDRLAAATYRRYRESLGWARPEARSAWSEALAVWRRLDEPVLEAEVLTRFARDHFLHNEYAAAVEWIRPAVAALDETEERYLEARARSNLGSYLVYNARLEEAIEHWAQVVELARTTGDRRLAAEALYGMGSAYQDLGKVQPALSHFEAAVDVLPENDVHTRPLALHNLASLHTLYFRDPDRSRELLLAALAQYRPDEIPTHAAWTARLLKQLGLLAWDEGRIGEARRRFEEALAMPTAFDACGRATTVASLALLEEDGGAARAADARMAEAFELLRTSTCPAAEVSLHRVTGLIAERRERPAEALAAFERSRDLAEKQGDRTRLADSLFAIARVEQALGRPRDALAANGRALAILEQVRPTVLREDLRTEFFATAQEAFDLQIELLSGLGADEEAWAVAERARAQALRDLLIESSAGRRGATDPALAGRERALQRRLGSLESTGRDLKGEELRARRREIDDLVDQLERVRGEIRRRSPAEVASAASRPLSLAEVRRDLLDDDTLLLEYRLGEETSRLWAIGRDSFASFALPPRAQIEHSAEMTGRWTRSLQWPGRNPPPVCELAGAVLGPAAPLLGGRRLVVVADGALEAVAFAALPDPAAEGPCEEAPPLVARHEVVHLPSVAALAAQRRSLSGRVPAPGWLAVVADPVYSPEDERLRRAAGPRPAAFAGLSGRSFRRLRHAGEEAAAVLAGLPADRTFAALGFDASKATVTGGALAGYRVLHFATHGVLDPEQPLLSFLALSGRDPRGRPVDGALYAHEIYGLDLPAELVTLSACDTALGRHVPGEGLVSGLPRAFLYAGAARVLVSLWAVEDRSTRELMERFYRGLLRDGLPPGRALQEAQRSLWRAGRPPYQWAGFFLQGDWRPLPPIP